MANIDLDGAKRARAETRGEGHTFSFGGMTFELPAELGYDVAEALVEGNWRNIMAGLVGEQADSFFALNPTVDDLRTLLYGDEQYGVPGVMSLYGTKNDQPGESSASSSSSTENGDTSRPPSSLSTVST